MNRPITLHALSAALSALIWTVLSGLLRIALIGRFTVTPLSDIDGLAAWLISFGYWFVVAFGMHVVFAKLVARVRGLAFWLMPILIVPIAANLLCIVEWLPRLFWTLRAPLESSPFVVDMLERALMRNMAMVADLCWLVYPLTIANQYLVRALYRRLIPDRGRADASAS